MISREELKRGDQIVAKLSDTINGELESNGAVSSTVMMYSSIGLCRTVYHTLKTKDERIAFKEILTHFAYDIGVEI